LYKGFKTPEVANRPREQGFVAKIDELPPDMDRYGQFPAFSPRNARLTGKFLARSTHRPFQAREGRVYTET